MKYTYNTTPDYEYEAGLLIARHFDDRLCSSKFLQNLENTNRLEYDAFVDKYMPLVNLENLVFTQYTISDEDYSRFFAYRTIREPLQRASMFDMLHDIKYFAELHKISVDETDRMKKAFIAVLFEDISYFTMSASLTTQEFIQKLRTLSYPADLNWILLDIYEDIPAALSRLDDLIQPVADILRTNHDIFDKFEGCLRKKDNPGFFEKNHSFEMLKNSDQAEIRYCYMGYNEIAYIIRPPYSTGHPLLRYGIAVDDLAEMKESSSHYTVGRMSDKLKALSDKTRLMILYLLKDHLLCGQELTDILNLSNATISHHMNILLMEGFVNVSRATGNTINYTLNREEISKALDETNKLLS